ncbi:Rho termination factor N-terminal domain-containing protein [Microcella daejeonensis]
MAQLRGRARAAGITGYSRMTKAQLVALLSS